MMETQKWFHITTGAISLGVPAAAWLGILRPELAHLSPQASAVAVSLFILAIPGLYQMLRLFLPITLAKLIPRLDR